jgi:hypothetical protein
MEKASQTPFMQAWQKAYLNALIDELRPAGDVLEVGFKSGYAAERIQTFRPKRHIIIESDPELVQEAKKWAAGRPNTDVIENTWQKALPALGSFDTVFYNDFPMSEMNSDLEMVRHLNPQEAAIAAKKAKELMQMLEAELAQFAVHYSDQEIDAFCKHANPLQTKELPGFLRKLKEKGYISEQQYQNAIKKYHLDKEPSSKKPEPMLAFLNDCLQHHMHKGSRFSAFLKDTTSKYEDSQFFDRIITNPNLDYQEKLVPIQIPNYQFNNGLVMIVEKLL